jgi:excisionase family DNA binding protein
LRTSPNSQKDFSAWPTKQQAADAIGVSTKLIEQLAKEKKLQAAKWKRPEGGPAIAVYHPADVDRLRQERNPDAAPFVLPAEAEPQKAVALRQQPPDVIKLLAAAIASQKNGVRIPERLFLTIPEAADYSGLPQTELRRRMKAGTLPALKTGGGWRIRRADLEQL